MLAESQGKFSGEGFFLKDSLVGRRDLPLIRANGEY